MRNLSCNRLEMDEIWGFVGKKEKHVRLATIRSWAMSGRSARSTPIRSSFRRSGSARRDKATATAFVEDVADRMKNRVQISTDGLEGLRGRYRMAPSARDVDYRQIIKTYGHEEVEQQSPLQRPRVRLIRKEGHLRTARCSI